jgi:endonuclease YncB( thermonuclease family)
MTTDPESIPNVPCKDMRIHVYIYDVYDGDTVNFLMLSGGTEGTVLKLSLRLLGIDTPEIRGGQGHTPEEKIAGELARNRLAEIIGARASKDTRNTKPRKCVLTKIIIRDWDKFGGRVLGDIILQDGRSAVDIMIAEKYGRRYGGDKKIPWTVEDLSQPPFRLI